MLGMRRPFIAASVPTDHTAATLSDSQTAAGSFYRFLTKPVSVDELTAVLEEILVPAAD